MWSLQNSVQNNAFYVSTYGSIIIWCKPQNVQRTNRTVIVKKGETLMIRVVYYLLDAFVSLATSEHIDRTWTPKREMFGHPQHEVAKILQWNGASSPLQLAVSDGHCSFWANSSKLAMDSVASATYLPALPLLSGGPPDSQYEDREAGVIGSFWL